ncbi:MAG: metallophosphoesterase [Pyrinomonadaceae bacterium]
MAYSRAIRPYAPWAVALITAATAFFFAYSYFIEPDRLVIYTSTLKIKDWDPAFDQLKIVVLGDIHGGSHCITKEKLQSIVSRINEQSPDLVVFLGDFVSPINQRSSRSGDKLRMPLAVVAANLAGIKSTFGVFAVLGNHDGAYGDDSVATALGDIGLRVLQNEVVAIEKNGARLRILGMADHLKLPGSWRQISDDAKRRLQGTGEGNIIVLEHSPDIVPAITGDLSISSDLKLLLAAHTHGGQIRFPIVGPPIVPSSFGQKFVRGHIKNADVDVFITSGIGTSILPLRFLVPPEIAVLTIEAN